MLGFDKVGAGPQVVVILNDWISDTSTWDGARVYLGVERFTWVFADLRGYGRSKGQGGAFTVEEAAADVLALADAQKWTRFAIVGHSMSTLIALHLAQHAADRIERAVLLTPPPPAGFAVDDATLAAMQSLGHGDDAQRVRALERMVGERLSERWLRFKAERWRATSDPAAVAGYVAMFARAGVPAPTAKVACPRRPWPPIRRSRWSVTHVVRHVEARRVGSRYAGGHEGTDLIREGAGESAQVRRENLDDERVGRGDVRRQRDVFTPNDAFEATQRHGDNRRAVNDGRGESHVEPAIAQPSRLAASHDRDDQFVFGLRERDAN